MFPLVEKLLKGLENIWKWYFWGFFKYKHYHSSMVNFFFKSKIIFRNVFQHINYGINIFFLKNQSCFAMSAWLTNPIPIFKDPPQGGLGLYSGTTPTKCAKVLFEVSDFIDQKTFLSF